MPYYVRNRVPICAVIDDLFQYYTRWPRENSSLLYLPAFLGGTDAAGYKPHDVCMLTVHIAQLAYKLEGQKLTRTSISDQYYTRWPRVVLE